MPALAPRHAGRTRTAECSPEAWEMLKADYLRPERPTLESCVRRLQKTATENGWTIPSEKTLRRRMEREVPDPVRILARHGADALKRMYPAQQRDRSVFHALEAVNADGHRFDVFVRWPDGEIARPCMTAIQDVYSGLLLAWRVDQVAEGQPKRLLVLRPVDAYGIPGHAYLDNGRNFASKWMTGGIQNRFRFKVRDEEPAGILTSLGVEVHWTTPYSGQSKPIERAFRDLCDTIAKHPSLAGAWVGNSPVNKPENYGSKAIDLDVFLATVADGIVEHNARTGRRSLVCAGRSFLETFAESYRTAPIRKATPEQRRLWLLAAESIRAARRDGVVRLLDNRFWGDFLAHHRGQPLVARFDPQSLHDGIHVYRLDGSYLGFAECIQAAGFNDIDAAREHGRRRRQWMRAQRDMLEAARRMSPEEVAAQIPEAAAAPAPEAKVVRLVAGAPVQAPPHPEPTPLSDDEQAAADRMFAELQGEPEADNVVPLPANDAVPNEAAPDAPASPEGRPHFADDEEFGRWMLTDPPEATDSDRAYFEKLCEGWSFRQLLGLNDTEKESHAG